jgi:hypothetical protein
MTEWDNNSSFPCPAATTIFSRCLVGIADPFQSASMEAVGADWNEVHVGVAEPYWPLSAINIRPQAMVANTGMAKRDGWRQRLAAIEQAGPPDHPLS